MISFVAKSDLNGTEVRWYVIYRDWHVGRRPIISASKNGVFVCGYTDQIPEPVYTAAHEVAQKLKRNPRADVRRYATHRLDSHDLVPIERPAEPVEQAPACPCIGQAYPDRDCPEHGVPAQGGAGE